MRRLFYCGKSCCHIPSLQMRWISDSALEATGLGEVRRLCWITNSPNPSQNGPTYNRVVICHHWMPKLKKLKKKKPKRDLTIQKLLASAHVCADLISTPGRFSYDPHHSLSWNKGGDASSLSGVKGRVESICTIYLNFAHLWVNHLHNWEITMMNWKRQENIKSCHA